MDVVKFKHYKEYNTFQSEKDLVEDGDIVFVLDLRKIYTHGLEYKTVTWNKLEDKNIVDKKDTKAGDIVFWDGSKQQIVKAGTDLLKYYNKGWTPIGVIVIPVSHDVYSTGEGAMMAINAMDRTTPDTGSTSNFSMTWGPDKTESLKAFRYIPIILTNVSLESATIVSQMNLSYLPSDRFTTNICGHDNKSGYYNGNLANSPSPYLSDGSRNSLYYSTKSPSSTENCLSDFNGKSNTDYLCLLAPEGWKTSESISSNVSSYPSACCCWRYHTVGTELGDWYLPAMGELGYMMARYEAINAAITEIKKLWGLGVGIATSYNYWSSTNSSANGSFSARFLYTATGRASYTNKYESLYVRAFCRI